MKNTAFCLFEDFYQKKNMGSSRIRGRWLLNYMPEAEKFVQGKNYEVVIYQKAYWKEHMRAFKGIKILDICDADWMEGLEIVELLKEVDCITTSSENLKEAVEKFTDTPVRFIPDRIDFNEIPKPRGEHYGKAKMAVWYGYSHNMDVINPCLMKIKKMGLKLKVISDGNYITRECDVENVKWEEHTVNQEIKKADFAILPTFTNGRFRFKSNNKETLAWALGLPVAKTSHELERFMSAEERNKERNQNLTLVKNKYDIMDSVKELREIIDKIKWKRSK